MDALMQDPDLRELQGNCVLFTCAYVKSGYKVESESAGGAVDFNRRRLQYATILRNRASL
jgi:hypothetical protein